MKNKKKLMMLAGTLVFCCGMAAETVEISTPHTSLVLDATNGQELKQLYYGDRLAAADLAGLNDAGGAQYAAYPVYGTICQGETALAVRHTDGNLSLQMEVTGVSKKAEGNATVTTVSMKDKVYPLRVDVCYKTYADADVIETWTEISHEEKGTVTLNQFASGYLPIRRGTVWLSSLYGAWANEAQVAQELLEPGMKVIKNKDGLRNSHTAHAEVMFSLDGRPRENSGAVIGAALCYGGNYKLRIDTDESEYHHFFAGINEENSAYNLPKGEVFRTPALALTYSQEGLSGASRNFHKWGRKHRLMHGDKERMILLNSWEGVYFNINQEGMAQMMQDIAQMGGELFVMDDGWFGSKYQRNSDNAALGDWTVDSRKLPEGIEGLLRDAKKNGVKFGIWIEPEATNTTSELYKKHPEWIINALKREPATGRGGTQLMLDLGNPEVQDFVFGIVDNLMTKYPEIAYIKWDSNMGIQSAGSTYLTKDNQSHLYINYHRGFEDVCQRIRAKYPDLVIQACASGGARANWGVLPYFDEFWVSDNTDALQRIYMQWGTSYFFPAIAMGSHIGSNPNHQTFRNIPIKFRIDVAMSGRLGMEIQPKNMTEEEKALCKNAIAEYKQIRPVVQFGDIYRLVSPYDKLGVASLMYVSEAKDRAVFYWWKTETFVNQHLPRVRMAGLDPAKTYRIHELNRIDNKPLKFEGKAFTGQFLMDNGLEIPYTHDVDYNKLNSWASRVLCLEEVK